jgi:hypothetical protein
MRRPARALAAIHSPLWGILHAIGAILRSASSAWPLGAGLGVDELAAEALAELIGVLSLGKAEDDHIGVVVAE